ncbi:hypothetical protein [Streptomyces sp. SYSU K21746]
MAMTDFYGTHPERLSPLLGDMTQEERGQVVLLNWEENVQAEQSALGWLARDSEGRVNWESAPFLEQEIFEDEQDEVLVFRDLLRRHMSPGSRLVVLWDNVVIPSLAAPFDLILAKSKHLLASGLGVWIHSASDGVLIESASGGVMTVAKTPGSGTANGCDGF